MAERDFFESDAKKKTGDVIKEIETKTSAEVVVALRHRVAEYRSTDLLFGFGCACSTLGALWLSPTTYALERIPFEMLGAFVFGAVLSAFVAPLRRLLTPKASVKRQTDVAARAAFYDLGISKTNRRTGVLVFVSMYESAVVLVPDVSIPKEAHAEFEKAQPGLETAIRGRDLTAFFSAMKVLGEGLAKTLPRKAGDQNELPDEPQ